MRWQASCIEIKIENRGRSYQHHRRYAVVHLLHAPLQPVMTLISYQVKAANNQVDESQRAFAALTWALRNPEVCPACTAWRSHFVASLAAASTSPPRRFNESSSLLTCSPSILPCTRDQKCNIGKQDTPREQQLLLSQNNVFMAYWILN